MHTASGLLNASHREASADYEQLHKLTDMMTRRDAAEVLRHVSKYGVQCLCEQIAVRPCLKTYGIVGTGTGGGLWHPHTILRLRPGLGDAVSTALQ